MTDGGITDRSAAMSDIHNLAAIHGFIGYKNESTSKAELKIKYIALCDIYHCPPDHHWQVDETIDDGHDYGGEYDDLVSHIFQVGSPVQVRKAVKAICDLFCQDKSTAEILADIPFIPYNDLC